MISMVLYTVLAWCVGCLGNFSSFSKSFCVSYELPSMRASMGESLTWRWLNGQLVFLLITLITALLDQQTGDTIQKASILRPEIELFLSFIKFLLFLISLRSSVSALQDY